MTFWSWVIFVWAAILEVGGDAVIRHGLRHQGLFMILLGFLALGCYGLVVNLVRWDFSRMLGVYVGVFAAISVLVGRYLFHEVIPFSTWVGLGVVLLGGLIIQLGPR